MKIVHAVALTAMLIAGLGVELAAPASAQTPNVNLIPETKSRTPEEVEQDRATDKAYRESLRKIPDSKAPTDPWGSVRSSDAPKPTAAKPRIKTGTAN